jgi:uncharacterized protein
MQPCYLDSSALVKRYLSEKGSAWVTGLLAPPAGNTIHLASITGVEVVAVIARRQRGGGLTAAQAAALIAQFRQDLAQDFRSEDVTPGTITQAMHLAETPPLRGCDAVQLAVALEINSRSLTLGMSLMFVCADVELNAAATAEGLTVEDPNAHP